MAWDDGFGRAGGGNGQFNYFEANPDVARAYEASGSDMSPADFALWHYDNYGVNEGRQGVLPTGQTTFERDLGSAGGTYYDQYAPQQNGVDSYYALSPNAARGIAGQNIDQYQRDYGDLYGQVNTTANNNYSRPPSGAGGSPGIPTGAQTGNGLVQGVNVNQYDQNPYLSQMGTVLTNRVVDNLNRNVMPGIRSNAVAAGGFGGSRQGVVEANAMKDANQTISDALTGAYFQDFTNQMNRNLAQYGQNQNFFSNQRGQDLQQLALGANLFQQGNQGWLSQGQGLLGLGQTQQQAPWQVINNANAGLGQWSGYGTTTSANQGGGAQGALGGAMAGGQLGKLWGGAGLGQMTNSQIEQSWGLPG